MQSVLSRRSLRDRRPEMVREYFAANLKRLLRERGFKQNTFAAEAGVSDATVSLWLNAHRFPEDKQLDRICEVLKVDIEELFRDPTASPKDKDPVVKFLRLNANALGYELVKKKN